jgi:hypothetical protein
VASGIRSFAELDVAAMRAYRLHVETRERMHVGGRLRPHTVRGSHRVLMIFMRWAEADGHDVDPRILALPGTRLPSGRPTCSTSTSSR